ncbi:MAG: hypothetical protein GF381_01940 [Candidatus Pacebacteria bacterium]|nr:hypothetical protein [Candidatus Paceibacterota bacterium]
MYQTIHERIEVIGVYKQAQFKPVKFQWQQKIMLIDQITLVSDFKDGQVKKRTYSVQVGVDLYRLEFNRETEVWWLEEVWVDG